MKLLLVEDEPLLLKEMDSYLTEQGYQEVEKATNFEEGEDKITLHDYDAIVLDITLARWQWAEITGTAEKETQGRRCALLYQPKTHSQIN